MSIESTQSRSEVVKSLAATIHKKIVTPAAGKLDVVNLEIKEINQRIAGLEKEVALLTAAHGRTRITAAAAALGVAVLLVLLIIPFLK